MESPQASAQIARACTFAALVALSSMSGQAVAQPVSKSIYCCDVGGQPVCGDILPAACYGRAYREMSPSGVVRRIVAAPLTREEIAARAAAERQRRVDEAERQRQLRLDQALFETYRNLEDLDFRRDRELRELDQSIRQLRERESELIARQHQLIDEATRTNQSDVAAGLEDDFRLLDSEIAAQSSVISAKLRDRSAVVERFEEHRARFIELTEGGNPEARAAILERR